MRGGWSFGKVRFEWMNRVVDSSNDDGMNWQVMRMADIYLMEQKLSMNWKVLKDRLMQENI